MKVKEMHKRHFTVYGLIVGTILCIYSFIILAVLIWGFLVSMKPQGEFFTNAYPWWKEFDFKYLDAITTFKVYPSEGFGRAYYDLGGMFINSITYSIACAFVSTISPLVMAYVAAKYKYKFSGFLPKLVLTVMVIPIVGSTASTLEIVKSLNLYDTFIGAVMLKAGFTTMYFLVFYSAFQTLSWDYAEAAFVDGASHTYVMFGIMLPLVKPMIFSVFLIFFVTYWNDYTTLLTYFPSFPTAALGLFYFNRNSTTSANETMLLTGCMLVTIPVIVLFLIFSDKLMGNISMGGIKE